jgi:hypothetical protein
MARPAKPSDDRRFRAARLAANELGMDTWDASFRRQERGLGDDWFMLMQTNDPERIDRVLGLAEDILPLDDIATRPGLEFIVQGLRRFPGKGWVSPFCAAQLDHPKSQRRDPGTRPMGHAVLAGRGPRLHHRRRQTRA